MKLDIIVLAAGKGKRMASNIPKVLLPLGGQPMIFHILEQLRQIRNAAITLVVSDDNPQVGEALMNLRGLNIRQVTQTQQLGTGHAVACALEDLNEEGVALILYGDVPLLSRYTIERIIRKMKDTAPDMAGRHNNRALWLTAHLSDPSGYGRILRNAVGNPFAIVEEKDCSPMQQEIKEVNTGIMAAPIFAMKGWLTKLLTESPQNAQKEYLLTDLMAMAYKEGYEVITLPAKDKEDFLGANDMWQLSRLERIIQMRRVSELARQGVYFRDPSRVDLVGSVKMGENVKIGINVVFSGKVKLGDGVCIGNHCSIKNSSIGDGSQIHDFCYLEDSKIGKECSIGPYARLRPDSVLADQSHIGNFVEIKNSRIGKGSKASHLSYIGDSKINGSVNIGAGVITCNYDGKAKHQTNVKDGAFIGSNSSLVAPINIGKNVVIGAGSVITKDVPNSALGLTRSPQKNIENYNGKSSKRLNRHRRTDGADKTDRAREKA